MEFKYHIFDVGAFNGVDGLALAIKNPNFLVHAFEANPDLINLIGDNKKKIEDYKKIKIINYKLNSCAVSDKIEYSDFNIAKNPTVSSLNKFVEHLDENWQGYKDEHFKYIKKVKVKVITLKKYCEDNNINNINYLHIDTQGNDLKVIKGLDNKINIIEKGVLEAAVDKKKSLYEENHTINDVKIFLSSNGFQISKIENIDNNIKNEKNIFFYNKELKAKQKIILNYNTRYFNRIVSNRITIKDKIFDYFEKYLNKIINIINAN